MESLQLLDDLYYVGCVDHGLKVFDSIMPLEYGTSYNSYLLKRKDTFSSKGTKRTSRRSILLIYPRSPILTTSLI